MTDCVIQKIPMSFDPWDVRKYLVRTFGNRDYVDDIFARKNRDSITESIYALVCLDDLMKAHFPNLPRPKIAKDSNGRRYFENSTLSFSVSHSHGFVALAISDHSPIGVDIENTEISPERANRVALRFFTEGEREMAQRIGFSRVWTAKEAYTKYLGLGLCATWQNSDISDPEIQKLLSWQEADGMTICICQKIE